MERVRRFARREPFLYKTYLVATGKSSAATFPGPSVDLHLTGFPRSANTYVTRLVEHVRPDIRLSTHIHTVASLRAAQRHDVPTLVLIREPLGAAASALVKAEVHPGTEPATYRCLADYIDYYRFVAKHRGRIGILDFATVTSDAGAVFAAVSMICPDCGIALSEAEAEMTAQEVFESIRNKDQTRDVNHRSLPSPEKMDLKQGHSKYIESHTLYSEAEKLYKSLRPLGPSDEQFAFSTDP